MWEKMILLLRGRGLFEVNLHKEGTVLYYTETGETAATLIWLIREDAAAEMNAEIYARYLETIRGIFRGKGYTAVNCLTVWLSKRINDCRQMSEGNAFWIADEVYGRLVIDDGQPEDFLGLRTMMERYLTYGNHSRNEEGFQGGYEATYRGPGNPGAAGNPGGMYRQPGNPGAAGNPGGMYRQPGNPGATGMPGGMYTNGQIRDNGTEADRERIERYREAAARQKNQTRQVAQRKRRAMPVTGILIGINVLLYLVPTVLQSGALSSLINFGSNSWELTVEEGEWYRLFTCMFLHFSFDHLVGNMICLFAVGEIIEDNINSIRFTILYLLSGLFASLASLGYYHIIGKYVYSAGASGAIYGLLGAYLMFMITDRNNRNGELKGRIVLFVAYLLYNFVRSSGFVDNAAHIGGLLSGAAIYLIMSAIATRRRKQFRNRW